jgi:hypothetical protein
MTHRMAAITSRAVSNVTTGLVERRRPLPTLQQWLSLHIRGFHPRTVATLNQNEKKTTNSGPQNPNAARMALPTVQHLPNLCDKPEFRTEVHSRCFYNDNVTQVALTTSLKRGPGRGTGPPGTASGPEPVPLAMHFGPDNEGILPKQFM